MEILECDRFWAVFAGAEGEDVKLIALFPRRELAEQYIKLPDPDEPGETLVFDPAIDVAVIHDGAIWFGNNFEIETHDQLIAALEAGRSAEGVG